MKKPLIPFDWLPASWGLKGKTREIAHAEYELSGIELEYRLAEIHHDSDENALKKAKLDIQKKYQKISQEDYEKAVIELQIHNEQDKKLALLELDLKLKKINTTTYEKLKADLLGEPWVSMPKIHWDPLNNGKTFFELDYNENFIAHLKKNGYTGTDDEIINRWLNDVCISISEEIGSEEGFILPVKKPNSADE